MHILTRIFSRISQNQKSEYEILKITVKITVNLSVNMLTDISHSAGIFPGIGANWYLNKIMLLCWQDGYSTDIFGGGHICKFF